MRNWLIICLFLLQALTSSLTGADHRRADATGVSASLHCEAWRRGDGAPSNDRRAAPCCILCIAGGGGDADGLVFVPAFAEPFIVPLLSADRALPPAGLARKLAGWASSWSSRAPPRIS